MEMSLEELEARSSSQAEAARSSEPQPVEPSDRGDDRYVRLLAEFDNYRKRTERERQRLARQGKRDLIMKLLDVADGLDQALAHTADEFGPVGEGLRVIHRQLLGALKSEGVVPFESLGERFNPDLHDAVTADTVDEPNPGTVVKEYLKGYRWGDDVLRHARVGVAR